jgi:HEAT repeat protein
MTDMIDRIEEALKTLLTDPSPAVREAASDAMDRTRAKRSVEAHRERMRTGTQEEKIRIVYFAGEIGGAEGVSLLLQALADESEMVRGAAARSLSLFPSPPVLRSLWERLPKERGIVLANLVETLGASGRKELAPQVEKFLDHPDAEVRAKAVAAFSRLTEGSGWEKVLSRTADGNEMVRAAVAGALGNWTASRP